MGEFASDMKGNLGTPFTGLRHTKCGAGKRRSFVATNSGRNPVSSERLPENQAFERRLLLMCPSCAACRTWQFVPGGRQAPPKKAVEEFRRENPRPANGNKCGPCDADHAKIHITVDVYRN